MPVNLSYVPPVAAAEPRQAACAPAGFAAPAPASYAPPPVPASYAPPPVAASYAPPPMVIQQHPSYIPPAAANYAPPHQQAPSYVPAAVLPAHGSCMPPAVALPYAPPPVYAAEPSVSWVPLPEVFPCGPPPMQVRCDAHNTPRFAPVAHPVVAVPARSQNQE